MHPIPRLSHILAELKRRRVFRTLAVYGAGGFAVLQGLELLQPVLFFPGWVYRIAGIALIATLPVAVGLTWVFDFGGGLVRTPPATPEEIEAIVHLPRARRWPAGLLALAGVALLVVSTWIALHPRAPAAAASRDRRPAVAVLPFVNRSNLPRDAFFVEGLHDDILVQLSRLASLRVIARNSVLRFRDSDLPLHAVADSLGASAILEGAVQRSGDRVRVSAELVDPVTDAHLWAQSWDQKLTPANLLAIQEELAKDIAMALQVSIAPEDSVRLHRPDETGDFAAYSAFLHAQSRLAQLSREGLMDARGLFEEALSRDPSFAEALAGLATARAMIATFTLDGHAARVEFEAAEADADRVLTLRPTSAQARVAKGIVALDARYDARGAIQQFLAALELRPGDPVIRLWHARALMALGRYDEAARATKDALRLDPFSGPAHAYHALALWGAGRTVEADSVFRRALSLGPSYGFAYVCYAVFLAERHDHARLGNVLVGLGRALGYDRPEALRPVAAAVLDTTGTEGALREVDRLLSRTTLRQTDILPLLALMGVPERTAAAAAVAADSGSQWQPFYHHPLYQPLRGTAAIHTLLRARPLIQGAG